MQIEMVTCILSFFRMLLAVMQADFFLWHKSSALLNAYLVFTKLLESRHIWKVA